MNNEIQPHTAEDQQRFIAGLRNGILLSIPLWALIIWTISYFI